MLLNHLLAVFGWTGLFGMFWCRGGHDNTYKVCIEEFTGGARSFQSGG